MNSILKKTLIAVSCSAALFLSACNSDDKDDYNPIVYQNYVSEKTYNKDSIDGALPVSVMTYKMPNVQGKQANATAMVMFPKIAKPKDGWRIVVWEHGTVGVGDSCAPSNNAYNPRFKKMAESLLAQGFVVVAPDYEGLGTSGIHPYLNLGSEANSAIYAVKAVKERYGKDIQGSWMSVGQSQGGHGSLGTAEYANDDSSYKGAVAGAPASSLGFIITEVAPVAINDLVQAGRVEQATDVYAELLAYAAYTTVGIKAYDPYFNYKALFKERSQRIAEYAEGTTGENGLCLADLEAKFKEDIQQFLIANKDKSVMDYPALIETFDQDPVVKKFLEDNQPATKKINTPVMIIQGTADMAVPYPVTDGLQQRLAALGTKVTFLPVKNASHTQAIVEKNPELVAFIKQHMPAK
ncbi:alpha/beta hydrolase family protein [Acinetobacter rudis]|nr:lipase family protein [Acinetobacter rudis]